MKTLKQVPISEDGFTLLEALVAAAVLAAIFLLMAPALIGAMNAAARSDALTEKVEMRANLDGVIHELFSSMEQATDRDGALNLAGDRQQVSFLVRPPEGVPSRATLWFEQSALRLSLVPLAEGVAPPGSATLIEGFAEGRLSYVGLQRPGWRLADATQWDRDWPPRLVVLHLRWPDGQQTRIQARVAGEGRAECRFDSGRGLCLGDSY